MCLPLQSSTLEVTGGVSGGPAHATSFNRVFQDTVSCRVALKGSCFRRQMVVRAGAEGPPWTKSRSRGVACLGAATMFLTSSIIYL